MKKNNENPVNNNKEESKSLDYYVQLYTQIVRELSENLKTKKDMINDVLYNETDLNKTLNIKKHFEHLRNNRKLF